MSEPAASIENVDGMVVVRASGDLDLASAPALERALTESLQDGQVETLTLDLRALSFMDSTGLRVVLATDARMRAQGRELFVIKGPPSVHRVFELALLEERLRFVEPAERGGSDADA